VDYRRSLATFVVAAGALVLGFVALAARDVAPPLLREALWTVPERRFEALTSSPAECLTLPVDRAARNSIALGRAAFQSPFLLGGQAARVGLSCASCHKNGRGNTAFHFPGLTSAPGTADVTSSLMSRIRGDGNFNPQPIPDLAVDAPKVSHDPASPALRAFVRGLIVEEFDGAEPPARVLDGLTAYVRALDSAACAGKPPQPNSVAVQIGEVVLSLAVIRQAWADRAPDSAQLAIGGLRDRLGQIAARYDGMPGDVKRLVALDRQLARLAGAYLNDPAQAGLALDRWSIQFARAALRLKASEPQSLYDANRLAISLGRSAPI
jgi:hypothetical protein